jgi:pentapeptide MXKDX repeat protein
MKRIIAAAVAAAFTLGVPAASFAQDKAPPAKKEAKKPMHKPPMHKRPMHKPAAKKDAKKDATK